MGFKKHNWTKYNFGGTRCFLELKDESNRKIDFFSWSTSDKNSEKKIGRILKEKYGINLSPKNII